MMSDSTQERTSKARTAGIIIIGDEILKGQVVDSNTNYLCKEFYSLGVKVGKVSVVGDVLEEIANEVRGFSETFDFVVTTGGVGPTHDDITYKGVARAFDEKLVRNADMVEMVDKWLSHKGYSQEIVLRMAEMPSSAKLIFDPEAMKSSFPIINVKNVYIFPGIPQYLRKIFPRLYTVFKGDVFYSRAIYVNRDEMSITPHLDKAVDKFKETVVFGSYPVVGNLYYSTRLTLESSSRIIVEEADQFLSNLLPPSSVVDFDGEPVKTAMEKVYSIVENKQHSLHLPVQAAVQNLEECLSKYELPSLCICFNGGKDCTALLHLFYAVLQKRHPKSTLKIPTLCIRYQDPFPEMDDFIREARERYNLDLRMYNGPIKSGLKEAILEHTEINAVLMGTRRSDPNGKSLDYFQMTDPEWPQVMRVSPMLDWTYKQVWDFLRLLTLPYCSLYDKGYTSIGNRSNTIPNESLAFVDESGKKCYRPAYMLHDGSEERNGRN